MNEKLLHKPAYTYIQQNHKTTSYPRSSHNPGRSSKRVSLRKFEAGLLTYRMSILSANKSIKALKGYINVISATNVLLTR